MDDFRQKKILLLLQVSEHVLNKISIPSLCVHWVHHAQEAGEVSGWQKPSWVTSLTDQSKSHEL